MEKICEIPPENSFINEINIDGSYYLYYIILFEYNVRLRIWITMLSELINYSEDNEVINIVWIIFYF